MDVTACQVCLDIDLPQICAPCRSFAPYGSRDPLQARVVRGEAAWCHVPICQPGYRQLAVACHLGGSCQEGLLLLHQDHLPSLCAIEAHFT